IYAASTSPGQRNLKKRIAYSSVSHMGFIIIGIGSITDPGLNGAILQIISHGFIGAALFFLAGTSYDRIRLVYLDEMGGMAISIPKIFTMFTILSMASLALPGMSGFVAWAGVALAVCDEVHVVLLFCAGSISLSGGVCSRLSWLSWFAVVCVQDKLICTIQSYSFQPPGGT